MSDIIIVDNFFPKLQERLLEALTLSMDIKWFYKPQPEFDNRKLAYEFRKNDENIEHLNVGQFRHLIMERRKIYSSVYESHLYNLKSLIEEAFKVEVDIFERMYFNLTTPIGIKTQKYGLPHTDMNSLKTKILIYYINDCDGDTVIFDEYYGSSPNPAKKTISQRISPKKSRAVMFYSNRYHTGSWPSEHTRRVLNVNFRVK